MTLSQSGRAATSGGPDDRLSRGILVLSAVVILGTIMTVLDLTIVNVAIPTLVSGLHATITSVQWVLTGYLLAFAAVIPVTGWTAGRFGAKPVWLAALSLFLAGSVLAAAAWSIGSLIAFRVLQGLGAGLILPVGQTILAQAAGPQRMGRVMSVIGVPLLLAPVFGPVLGGAILGAGSWRWIFLLNLPVGAAAIAAAWRLLPDARPQAGQRLDVRGLVLLCPGIAILLYGLSEAGAHGGFGSVGAAVATVAGLALTGLYIWHARLAGQAALIDLSLLRRRGFAAAAAMNFLLPVALFGSLILIPLYYQVIRHAGPVQTGLLLAPQGIGAALALPVAGLLTDKIGARVVCPAGLLLALLGALGYTQLGAHTSDAYLAAGLFVLGAGIGSTIAPSMAAAFRAVPPAEIPRATSALNTLQRIAGALGTALFAILLQHAIPASQASHPGRTQAVASAFGGTFWVAVALIAAALVPALLLPARGSARPGQRPPGAAPAVTPAVTIPERSRLSVTSMDEQETVRKLKLGNKILVVWPVGIASICLGLVGSGLVSPLWGVLLGLIMVVLCWFAWIFGRVLSDRAAASRPGSAASRPGSAASRPGSAASRPGSAASRPESGVSRPESGAGDRT